MAGTSPATMEIVDSFEHRRRAISEDEPAGACAAHASEQAGDDGRGHRVVILLFQDCPSARAWPGSANEVMLVLDADAGRAARAGQARRLGENSAWPRAAACSLSPFFGGEGRVEGACGRGEARGKATVSTKVCACGTPRSPPKRGRTSRCSKRKCLDPSPFRMSCPASKASPALDLLSRRARSRSGGSTAPWRQGRTAA
jgi:hypothetical protein